VVARRIAIRTRTLVAARRTLRVAARTAHRNRPRHGGCALRSDALACRRAIAASRGAPPTVRARAPAGSRHACGCANFRPVTGFYIAGIVLAAWALIVTAVGVTREDFPSSPGATRLVGAISVLLVVAAIGSAIYLSATEEEHEPKGEQAAAD
jgi:hypothetical protein